MDLPAKDVLQILVLEHRGRNRRRDPENFLLRLHLGGERHCLRAGIDAIDDLDLLLADQPLDLVDRHIDLALAIGIDRFNLVFAGNAAALIDEIDRDLSAHRAGKRAAAGEGAGQVVDDADPNGLRLGAGKTPGKAHCGNCCGGFLKQRTACGGHGVPP